MKPSRKLLCSLLSVAASLGLVGCGGGEDSLSDSVVAGRESDAAAGTAITAEEAPDAAAAPPASADAAVDLPGVEFEFELSDQVYIDLSGPSVVSATNVASLDWDLRFEGYQAFTNGGEAGVGKGASFGPSTDLDLLFDTIPDVPMRADLSDGAMMSWFWFSDAGITSRFHIYGVRDASGRTFKVQVLDYYGDDDAGQVSAVYTIRYAEVTDDAVGETLELSGIDATAGGVSAPAGAPCGCVDLNKGEFLELTKDEWATRSDWHLCFQRTDVFLNGGLSGPGDVTAVDLDVDPGSGEDMGLTDAERERTADSERERFDAVSDADFGPSYLGWDKNYEVLPRIGTRWLTGTAEQPDPVPGTWFIRGADGESYFSVYFTDVTPVTGADAPRVRMQVKSLAPI